MQKTISQKNESLFKIMSVGLALGIPFNLAFYLMYLR